jgi:2-oxoglutarate ferredoxin oxidoreductase subunit delta
MTLKKISNKISWSEKFCKKCNICINFCPVKTLELKQGKMIEHGKCILCGMCERYCPDMAIKVIGKKQSAK